MAILGLSGGGGKWPFFSVKGGLKKLLRGGPPLCTYMAVITVL